MSGNLRRKKPAGGRRHTQTVAFVALPWAWPCPAARLRSWPSPPAGRLHERFTLRAQVHPAADLIRSATTTAARLLCEEGRIGTLAVGAHADLLVLDGNPLEDISVLTKPREHLRHVIKGGHAHVTYTSTNGTLRPMPREHCVARRHRLRDVPVRGEQGRHRNKKGKEDIPLLATLNL